ncbi:MAG TPA: ABC transporter ATP-binding protein [Candidatus Angelobacter sp.]|nr:ABC transporter ATP-binding protein [Candidatus Angelobacter sp.]
MSLFGSSSEKNDVIEPVQDLAAAKAGSNGAGPAAATSLQTEAVRTVALVRHYRLGKNLIPAVDGVSMAAERGEFIALLGASGSGKSTLLNLIAGLDRPDSGAIVVDGQDLATVTGQQLAEYRRHTVGMVFQSFNLVPTMTLYENVELPMRFAEVRRKERRSRVEEAIEKVGLAGRAEHRPSEMSGGEQQRAAIARALVNRPKILLADEPTGNLDSKTGTEIMDLIAELNRTLDMTVIMVTHERALADRYADRMIFLADGKVQGETRNQQKGAAR